jgi:putative endopeptidase
VIQISPDDPVFDAADSDPSVPPSEDFYQFANGGWLESNPVPPEYGAWGSAHEVHVANEAILRDLLEAAARSDSFDDSVEGKVGAYYRSGMDTDRIEAAGLSPIEPRLERIDELASIDDIRDLVVDFHRIGVGVLFTIGVLPDFDDPSVNLLYVGQGGLGLPDRDYYLREDEQSRELLTAYRAHIENMFILAGLDGATSAADQVLGIEHAIAEVSYTNVQMRDVDLITNKREIEEAARLMPGFKLGAYVNSIGAQDESTINFDNVDLYPALDTILTETSLDDWKAYFRWHLLLATASALPEAFEDEAFEFYGKTLGGQQEQKDRWKRILAAGTGDIGQLISQMYVAENFTPQAKQRMEELVDHLLVAMRERLATLPWMGETTRREALAKLEGFGYKIGYPDEWRDYTGLEIRPDEWMTNRIAASRFEFDRQIAKLGQPVDPHEWSMAPHVVNAYYHPLRNEIVFPAGMLQPPFFTEDADDPVNYGAIGSVIGHEITHGFDDQGSKFDATGQMRNWWTDDDRTEFETRAQVIVDQFNAYEVEDGLNVNGDLTLGENIADLGGLKIAYAAMRSAREADDPVNVGGLSPEQRFYIAYARAWRQNYTHEYLRLLVNSDPHSPSHFRCTGPLSNMESFQEAFDISDDAPSMRAERDRVEVW